MTELELLGSVVERYLRTDLVEGRVHGFRTSPGAVSPDLAHVTLYLREEMTCRVNIRKRVGYVVLLRNELTLFGGNEDNAGRTLKVCLLEASDEELREAFGGVFPKYAKESV